MAEETKQHEDADSDSPIGPGADAPDATGVATDATATEPGESQAEAGDIAAEGGGASGEGGGRRGEAREAESGADEGARCEALECGGHLDLHIAAPR